MTEREFATDVVRRLSDAGYQALWAGGCVRDEQLGLVPADYDIATNAIPDQVKKLFRRCHGFGASFGVVEVLGPRGPNGEWLKVQVATFRSDGTYTDGRRPDTVTFSSPIEDAQRRDFTINGLFYDPIRQELIDYVGGQSDLQAKVLRAIGNPHERFQEDKLRILRAVRMATRFDLTIDRETQAAAQQMAAEICLVSVERIAEELRKILTHPRRYRGWTLLQEFRLTEQLFPELGSTSRMAIDQLFHALEPPIWPNPSAISFELSLAAILAESGAQPAARLAKRLKLSNQERDRLMWLVTQGDALDQAPELPRAQLYPMLATEGIGELLALHQARYKRDQQPHTPVDFCLELLQTTPVSELNPPPLITGDRLKELGFTPGPAFKAILAEVRTRQLNGDLQTAIEAQDWAVRYARNLGTGHDSGEK